MRMRWKFPFPVPTSGVRKVPDDGRSADVDGMVSTGERERMVSPVSVGGYGMSAEVWLGSMVEVGCSLPEVRNSIRWIGVGEVMRMPAGTGEAEI